MLFRSPGLSTFRVGNLTSLLGMYGLMSDVWKKLVIYWRLGSPDRLSVSFWLQGMRLGILNGQILCVANLDRWKAAGRFLVQRMTWSLIL